MHMFTQPHVFEEGYRDLDDEGSQGRSQSRGREQFQPQNLSRPSSNYMEPPLA